MNLSDFQIHSSDKLDRILTELCELVVRGQQNNPDQYGVVAAAVLDPDNKVVSALNYKHGDKSVHAERVAIDWLQNNGYDPAEYSVLPIVS